MRYRIMAIILLILLLSTTVMLVNAKGAPKEIYNKLQEIPDNFSGEYHGPYLMNENDIVGIQFSLAADAKYVGIGCPSWNNDIGELTFALYAFDTDYATSVSKTPIIKHTFKNFGDNNILGFEFSESDPLKAGEYVLEITEPDDPSGSGVGLWVNKAYPGQYFYENGVYNKTLSAKMFVDFIGDAPEVPYGTLTPVKVQPGEVNTDPEPFNGAIMRFTNPDAEFYYTYFLKYQVKDIYIEDGVLVVQIEAGEDPQFHMQIEEALQPVPCKDYPVMLIRMKREEGSPTSGQIFFTTTEFQGPQENGSAVITYEDTTEWQDIIIDFSNNKNYKGELLNFRFDIANSSDGEYTYLIEYILFFGTEEAARNFDISTLPTPSPTPEPTDTPEQTQTPVPEKTKTPEKSEDNEKGISITTIIIIIAAVLFVVAAVIIFIPKKGKKENA